MEATQRPQVGLRSRSDGEDFVENVPRIVLCLDLRESITILSEDVSRPLVVVLLIGSHPFVIKDSPPTPNPQPSIKRKEIMLPRAEVQKSDSELVIYLRAPEHFPSTIHQSSLSLPSSFTPNSHRQPRGEPIKYNKPDISQSETTGYQKVRIFSIHLPPPSLPHAKKEIRR
jgi:hypothetical protein